MDQIVEIIETFSPDDKKDFSVFLKRRKNIKDRKDLELLDLLSKKGKIKREDLLLKLYPEDKNLEAYHATRKRLLRQLMEYIQLKKKKGETVSEGYILSLISTAEYLFDHEKLEAAWNMLKQAEELAKKAENYSILSTIYSIEIENSQREFAPDLKVLLEQKRKYQQLAIEDDNANMANQLIRYELKKSLSTGREIDIAAIIKDVLKQYGLEDIVMHRPRLMYNIVSITRSAVLAGKQFYSFEPYIIVKYGEIEEGKGFNKYNHFYKVNFLYMIAHVLYRNKKFEQAERYLTHLHEGLEEYNRSHYSLLYPKYVLLRAAVYNYSGRSHLAIDLLEKLVNSKMIKLNTAQLLNAYLNLSTYYFQQEAYQKSIRIFQNVQHSDQWLMKVMGFEWVFKKNIIECINQFELGNSDLVEQRLKSIDKNFKEYFNRDLYKRVGVFLSLVRKLNDKPDIAPSKEFHKLVENSFEFIDINQEDIQAITFYGWLKAKMQRRKYYEVLLELVKS